MIEDGELSIGTVKAVFGIEGYLAVSSHSGEYEHYKGLERVILLQGEKRHVATIESVRETGRGILVRFAGFETPEKARTLVGSEIVVPREKAAPLAKGEFYATDVAGCDLVMDGKPVAKILSVVEGGLYDFFESELADGSVVLVPFSKEFIGEVDLPGRRVELLRDWILE